MSRPDFSPPDPPIWHARLRHHHRPAWWPENEEWPPRDRRHWRRIGKHNPFFRRLGCLFVVFNLLGFAFFALVLGFLLNAAGFTHFSMAQIRPLLPLGGILLAFVIVIVVLAGTNLRRMSIPLDDLLSASNRVAEGDYSVRVQESGPPEVRSLTRAFNSMASRLQTHDQQRRAMLADVTHELRTPLTIIQGNLEGVLDGLYPADAARLKTILEEIQIISRLTDDLKTLALAESGALQMRREQTDLAGLVRETVAVFQTQANAAGVEIELSPAKNELLADIDPERIRQVLTNLMSNALRYSPRGSVVRVGIMDSGTGPERRAVVFVADRGPGISTEDLPRVFDRYYKSADSRGMGLGLSIAKVIVEAHGGGIKAESPANAGTMISFWLPC